MHQVVPIDLLSILGKGAFSIEHLPKKALAGYQKFVFFALHQTTASCIGWVQVGGAPTMVMLFHCFTSCLYPFLRSFYRCHLMLSCFILCWDLGPSLVFAPHESSMGLLGLHYLPFWACGPLRVFPDVVLY